MNGERAAAQDWQIIRKEADAHIYKIYEYVCMLHVCSFWLQFSHLGEQYLSTNTTGCSKAAFFVNLMSFLHSLTWWLLENEFTVCISYIFQSENN